MSFLEKNEYEDEYEILEDEEEDEVFYTRTYSLEMKARIPRVYKNEQSLGYRKMQKQTISGQMMLGFSKDGKLVDVIFKDKFINKTHKLSSGNNVTYDVALDSAYYPRFNAIGSNKTLKFKTASIIFSIAADPSYNIGEEYEDDNSLFLTLAGIGSIKKNGLFTKASGYIIGTLGCGCAAYGHKSPTRKLDFWGPNLSDVDDVAAVYGTWKMKLIN